MAERRMFAKSIVLSDAFLDMPMSARCLYFTLGMLADDDGFVSSPKSIMRQCGASQDDMLTLLNKRYVLSFESGVIVIKHWRMNNYLKNDRHKQTTYVEEMATLTIDSKGAYTENIKNVSTMDTNWIPSGDTGKDSIGKNSIDKGSINIYQLIIDIYNEICVSFPPAHTLTETRKNNINARLKTYSMDDFKQLFEKAEASTFLKGGNKRNWYASFDWLIDDSNMAKVLEGNYDNKAVSGSSSGSHNYDFDSLEKMLATGD